MRAISLSHSLTVSLSSLTLTVSLSHSLTVSLSHSLSLSDLLVVYFDHTGFDSEVSADISVVITLSFSRSHTLSLCLIHSLIHSFLLSLFLATSQSLILSDLFIVYFDHTENECIHAYSAYIQLT